MFSMLITRSSVKQKLAITLLFFVTALFAGCGQVVPMPTATVEIKPTITSTFPIATKPLPTLTPPSLPLPACTPSPITYVFVIDESVYNNVDAGIELGAKGAMEILQQAMEDYHPEWGQEDLAGYIWDHSAAQMIGVNPRVLLVTAGVALDWQISNDHDVHDDIVQVGVTMTQHYREFRFNEELRSDYPQVANAASYALYAFFDFDLEKLNAWQQEYDRMFGDIQPRITTDGC